VAAWLLESNLNQLKRLKIRSIWMKAMRTIPVTWVSKMRVAAYCAAIASLLTIPVGAQQQQLLTHHTRPAVVNKQAKFISPLPATKRLKLAIMLPLSDQAGLNAFLSQIYDPQSPSYRQFLSVQQFTERFGPSQANYDAVVKFARANNMTVVATPVNRMLVDVEASVADINRTFHVTMGTYQHPTEDRTFFAPDREPAVDLNVKLWHIAGLDDFSPPRSQLRYAKPNEIKSEDVTGSGPGGTYLGSDIREAYYGATALTGAGQTIGIYGLNYNLSDIALYFSMIGQPFNPSQVSDYSTDGTVSTCPDNCNDGEPAVDIQQSLSMAPGANIIEYFGNSDPDVFNAAASANIARQMSTSLLWLPADPTTDEPIFQEMGAQGQSIFVATGDSGAYNPTENPGFYPADDPYVTGVGGTDLSTNGAGGAWASETAWIGSGGGIDTNGLTIPTYQQLTGVINSTNFGSTTLRNIPDVSSDANTDSFWCSSGACYEGIGGTSLAAPRWAGFMALINQQAAQSNEPPVGFLNPIIYPLDLGAGYAAAFHDITSGNDGAGSNGSTTSYTAVKGYDLATGWGSPNGQGLIDALTPASTAPYYSLAGLPTTVDIATEGSGTSTIQLTSGNGFAGSVALSAVVVGPSSGVTVSLNPTTVTGSGTSTLSVTITGPTPANFQIVVTGTSTATGVLTQPAYVTISTPGFALSSSSTTIYLNQSATATDTLTVAPENGFTGVPAFSASSLPSGVSASFNPSSSSSTTTMTLKASATAQTTIGTQFLITGAAGTVMQTTPPTVVVSAATGTGGSGTPVNLASAFNLDGIYSDGTTFSTAGLDGDGNAYSSNLLTANRVLNGVQFNFGPANAMDVVQGTGQNITLPAGQFTTLQLLGTAVNGHQVGQTLVVNYSDGTSTTFTQTFGDWSSGLGGAANESEAVAMQYVDGGNGSKVEGQRNLYAYLLALDSTKTVASLTLPKNSNVVVLAATLTTQNVGTQISLASAFNIGGLFSNGTTFDASLGMDGGGDGCSLPNGCSDAFSSQQLGLTLDTVPTLTFNNLVFDFGSVNTVDCTSACILDAIDLNPGVTVKLPANQQAAASTLMLLGTGVQGGGTATVTVNYTTGSASAFTQTFSDWCNFQNNQYETIAVGSISRINSDGTLSTGASCNLYAYTYPLDATRIVQSIALKNATSNFQTIVFAATLTPVAPAAAPTFTVSDLPSTLNLTQGSSGTTTVTVAPLNGFSGSVTLAASGLPSGVTAQFATNPATGSSVLTLAASSAAAIGTATVTITGTSGSLSATTTIALTVSAAPSFTVAASPATLALAQGASGTSTVTVTAANGFTGSVTLAASGLPSGVTAQFATNPATGSSVLTLAASSSATVGTATVTITGTSGSLSATTTIALTVTGPSSFTIAASPTTLTIAQNASGTSTITVTSANGFNSAVSINATGMPTGTNAVFSPTSITPAADGSATSTLTFTSSSTSAALHRNGVPLFPATTLAALLCCLGWKKRRPLQLILLLMTGVIGLGLLNGCGGSSKPQPTTSTITVTATSGALQQTTTISLTVN
jgi:Pro-kumamolisin, activation domain